jgi:hypothetical protein
LQIIALNIEFRSIDYIEKIFALETKFIYCYDVTIGAGREDSNFDFESNTDMEYHFKILSIDNGIAKITKDGYDNLGHYWQYGKFNVLTNQFYWEKIDR